MSDQPIPDPPVPGLDDPVWASLTGPHASWALGSGLARCYPADVSPFAALADHRDPRAWNDLHDLLPHGSTAVLMGLEEPPPAGWRVVGGIGGVQMIATALRAPAASAAAGEVVELGAGDLPEMLELVAATRPGPFEARTRELGTYLGVRQEGRLVAMAGERMRPAGSTEISAVCTLPAARGRGLASRLVLAVASGITARGEVPILHAAASNTGAIRLYPELGFTLRAQTSFTALAPAG